MNVLFDRLSHKVVGLNRPSLPFEYSLELEGTPILSKVIPIYLGMKQKVNENGQPLFLTEDEEGNPEETTESQKVLSYEEEDVEVKWVDENGVEQKNTVSQKIPKEIVDLEPVMVDNVRQELVSFSENPFQFTYDEVKSAKLEYSLEKRMELENTALQLALIEQFEMGISMQQENVNLMLAITELYENMM